MISFANTSTKKRRDKNLKILIIWSEVICRDVFSIKLLYYIANIFELNSKPKRKICKEIKTIEPKPIGQLDYNMLTIEYPKLFDKTMVK